MLASLRPLSGIPAWGRGPDTRDTARGGALYEIRVEDLRVAGLCRLGLSARRASLSGCDAAGGQKTEFKPIQTNILKKLGSASQGQSDAAKAEHLPARAKKKR